MSIVTWEFESPPLHITFKKKKCGNSSVGRAQPCQGWGREFESRFPLIRGKQFAYLFCFLYITTVIIRKYWLFFHSVIIHKH